MQSHTSIEVANRYAVTEVTVRNWIKRGALGANARKIGKRTSFRITTMHIEEFEKKTGATAFRPEFAPTRADTAAGRSNPEGGATSGFYKRENSRAVRNALGDA